MVITGRTVSAVALPLVALGLLAGCGGDTANSGSPDAAGSAEVSPPELDPSATGASISATGEACSLLSDENVQAIAGGPAEAEQVSAPGEAYSIDACTWSDPEIGPLISLQLLTPGSIADPLAILLGASGEVPSDYPTLPDGQTWNLGFLPGGGGVGYTVTWTAGGQQVALSALGDPITDAVKQAVDDAAADVNAELGG